MPISLFSGPYLRQGISAFLSSDLRLRLSAFSGPDLRLGLSAWKEVRVTHGVIHTLADSSALLLYVTSEKKSIARYRQNIQF